MKRCSSAWFSLLLLAAALPLRAQDDARPLAAALLASVSPATDDPDATVAALVAAAKAQPRSPVGALLLAEASRWIGLVQQPQPLLAAVDALQKERLHGLLAQEASGLRWRLQRAVHGDAAMGRWPLFGQPEQLLACGPFGDAGDDFVGVPFPPELQFPAVGTTLPGRGGLASTRVAERRSDQRRIELAAPPRYRQGCWYGRWRFDAREDADGFLEVECDGDCQVFADGQEVLRLERWRTSRPSRQYVGLRLPKGGHEVVVKTGSNGRSSVAMRCVDGEGNALGGLQPHDEAAAFAAGAPASLSNASFVTPEGMLARLAGEPNADPVLRVAAVLAMVRDGNQDAAIDLAEGLRRKPPDDAATALAFARVLRLVALPDELRKAAARALEERAAESLLPAHHTARLAKAALLEEQDQREDALRLLAAHPAPGPETFARRADVVRQVRFTAELVPLLRTWAAACPHDSRPLAHLATELQAANNFAEARALRQRSLQLRPDQPSLAQTMCRASMATSPVSPDLLAAAWPAFGGEVPLGRLRLELDWATASHDAAAIARLSLALAAHADADVPLLVELAAAFTNDGQTAPAVRCLQRCRELGDDRPALRAWLARLGGEPFDLDELLQFRRDGKAAAAAFTAGENEQRSSTTLVIDQHLLVLQQDGSWTMEIHTLRRVNDQAGVEAFREKTGLGQVDEVLLLRTLAADGTESVPAKVDGDYTFPRLSPGSFVEWRYREHGQAPGAGTLHTSSFVFGSEHEPTARCEFVVVLPTGRGELRLRGLPAPSSTTTLRDGRTVQVFEKVDLAPLAKERFLPSMFDLLPCAQVGEDQSPLPTLRGQRVQLGRRTHVTAPLREALEALALDANDAPARANAIWSFCQTAIEDGRADDALQTLVRKKGSRFLLATALLRAAGFQVLPLACRDARAELATSPESLFADDETVQLPGAMLLLPDGARLPMFVDTPRHWPLGRVPASRVGTTAWLLYDDHAEPFVLAGSAEGARNLRVTGRATVRDKDLVLTATIEIGDVSGFGLAEQLRQLKENVRSLAARQIAQQVLTGWRIDSASLASIEPGKPPRIEAVARRGGVQRDGERFVVPLPLPPSKLVADLGDREQRTLPWQLTTDMQNDCTIEFDPGPDLRLLRLPESVVVQEEPLQFTLQVQAAGNVAVCRRNVRVTAATRPAAAFGDWLRALATADRAELATIELSQQPKH